MARIDILHALSAVSEIVACESTTEARPWRKRVQSVVWTACEDKLPSACHEEYLYSVSSRPLNLGVLAAITRGKPPVSFSCIVLVRVLSPYRLTRHHLAIDGGRVGFWGIGAPHRTLRSKRPVNSPYLTTTGFIVLQVRTNLHQDAMSRLFQEPFELLPCAQAVRLGLHLPSPVGSLHEIPSWECRQESLLFGACQQNRATAEFGTFKEVRPRLISLLRILPPILMRRATPIAGPCSSTMFRSNDAWL